MSAQSEYDEAYTALQEVKDALEDYRKAQVVVTPGTTTDPVQKTEGTDKKESQSVKTGDDSELAVYGLTMMIAGCAVTVSAMKRREE